MAGPGLTFTPTATMPIDIETPLQQAPLTQHQKNALKTGNFNTFGGLLTAPLGDVARRCKISASDAKLIYQKLHQECSPTELTLLNELGESFDETFSTGDRVLDQALGGGIRTGILWEIVGESSAGKTQVALQLSLLVQNPPELGGISGSTCYLTTSSKLPTNRLKEIADLHPLLHHYGSKNCLSHIHTLSISTVPIIENILANIMPDFIEKKVNSSKPIKLVIIDALTELFHCTEKMNKTALFERSKDVNRIASALHQLASTYNVAVVVINEVIDRFDRGMSQFSTTDNLVYSDKSRWFSTSNSIPGENAKEASLGLVWANHLNVRIMLTKTGRRRYIDENEPQKPKKAKLHADLQTNSTLPTNDGGSEQQSTAVRRLSVIFSSVAPCVSLDYIVTQEGVRVLANDRLLEELQANAWSLAKETQFRQTSSNPNPEPAPVTLVQSSQAESDGDEWDRYWEEEDEGSKHIDWDALELSLTQEL